MKTAEEIFNELESTKGWLTMRRIDVAQIRAIQSDAIESTVRKCADVVSEVGKDYQSGKQKDEYVKAGLRLAYHGILSLIPQKEKKV